MSAVNLNSTTGIVLANTSNGPQTVILPVASNIAGRMFYVKDAFGSFGSNPLTLSTSAGDTFQGGATTFTLNVPNQTQQFITASSITGWNWYSLNGNNQAALQTQKLFVSSISTATTNGQVDFLTTMNLTGNLNMTGNLSGPTATISSVIADFSFVSTFSSLAVSVSSLNGNPVLTQAGNTLNITGVQQTGQGVAFLSTPNVQISATGSQMWQWGLNLPLSTIDGSPSATVTLTSNDAYTTFLVLPGCDEIIFNTTAISLTPYIYYIKNCKDVLGSTVSVVYDTGSGILNFVQGYGGPNLYPPLSNLNTATQILQWDGSNLYMY